MSAASNVVCFLLAALATHEAQAQRFDHDRLSVARSAADAPANGLVAQAPAREDGGPFILEALGGSLGSLVGIGVVGLTSRCGVDDLACGITSVGVGGVLGVVGRDGRDARRRAIPGVATIRGRGSARRARRHGRRARRALYPEQQLGPEPRRRCRRADLRAIAGCSRGGGIARGRATIARHAAVTADGSSARRVRERNDIRTFRAPSTRVR